MSHCFEHERPLSGDAKGERNHPLQGALAHGETRWLKLLGNDRQLSVPRATERLAWYHQRSDGKQQQ